MKSSMDVQSTMPNKGNDKVRVELRVQKSLMGYHHGSPSDYYVAVVGSGCLLGNNDPRLAPRCTRIANNIWAKEIWLPKYSRVCFKFLIVHASTHSTTAIEDIPARSIHIGQEPVLVVTRFNQAGIIEGHGIQEILSKLDSTVIANEQATKGANRKQKKIGLDEKNEDPKTAKTLDVYTGARTVQDNITEVIRTISETDKKRLMEEINNNVRLQEIESGRAGMKKILLTIHKTSLTNLNLRFEELIQAFTALGLPPCDLNPSYTTKDGFYRHEIWLSGGTEESPGSTKESPCSAKGSPSSTNGSLSYRKRSLKETTAVTPKYTSTKHVNFEGPVVNSHHTGQIGLHTNNETKDVCPWWFSSGKKKIFAAMAGVALASCLGYYAFWK